MLAEFEEKQYEQHLNNSLLTDRRLLFPPGQVLESHLGFDAALFTRHPEFWKNFPSNYKKYFSFFYKIPKGTNLPKMLWREIEDLLEDIPKFKFNAFIQHKRPEHMFGPLAGERHFWNNEAYYRYKLVPHQQVALSRIEDSIASKGVVVYACPAFHKIKELWDVIERGKIVEKSNFCQVGKLDNHKMYTFQQPGNSGIAHSEPEEIESYNLLSRFDELGQSEPSQSNTGHLIELANTVHSVMSEIAVFRAVYNKISRSLMTEEEENQIDEKEMSIEEAMVKIYAFKFLTNTDILIGY